MESKTLISLQKRADSLGTAIATADENIKAAEGMLNLRRDERARFQRELDEISAILPGAKRTLESLGF